jgi:hypothetical protein
MRASKIDAPTPPRDPAQPPLLAPLSPKRAFIFAMSVWVGFTLFVIVLQYLQDWPSAEFLKAIVPLVLLIGAAPLILVLVDFVAKRGGKIGVAGLDVDFGQTPQAMVPFAIPPNIGNPAPVVSGSSPLNIKQAFAVEFATPEIPALPVTDRAARIDLGEGDQWWVTRLFVLCARAVRLNHPAAFVFTSTKGMAPNQYVGWARPDELLDHLLALRLMVDSSKVFVEATFGQIKFGTSQPGLFTVTYGSIYAKAQDVARALPALRELKEEPANAVSPVPAKPIVRADTNGAGRYLSQPEYENLGEAALEAILLDQIALIQVEYPTPDRLTLARLDELFGPTIRPDSIDLLRPSSHQLAGFLASNEVFIGLTKGGTFDRLATNLELQQTVLRELASPAPSRTR